MHPSALALAAPLPASPALPGDAIGFEIGWEHARHGLVPPAELLIEGTALSQGWRAARAALGRRSLASTRALRQWLALRCQAWREGIDFDTTGLGPAELARLETGHCPVRGQALGGAAAGEDAPVFCRLNPAAGYRAGNLVVLSRTAALAARRVTAADALRLARAARVSGTAVRGLHAAHWQRLAVLLACTAPLPFQDLARLPLLVLPPPGVVPAHAVQALQCLLTRQFLRPGWSSRLRALAAGLPAGAHRTDFHLFVSALASRLLHARDTAPGERQAVAGPCDLEAAWLHERVQRRWQQWVLGMGEGACADLLTHALAVLGPSGANPVASRDAWPRHAPTPTQAATAPPGFQGATRPPVAPLEQPGDATRQLRFAAGQRPRLQRAAAAQARP